MRGKFAATLKILTALAAAAALSHLALRLSPYQALRDFQSRPVSTRIYDRNGAIIQIPALGNGVRREYAALDEIPAAVREFIIAAEDRRFYSHHGIDFPAILRALSQNVRGGRAVSGASTITMQLARIIRPARRRTVIIKIREMIDALRLEARLSKSQILELYLNSVPFGFNTEGVASAARTFFGTDIGSLTMTQAACIAVIVRRPALYNPLTNPENCAAAAFALHSSRPSPGETDEEEFLMTAKSARSFIYPFEFPHFVRYLSNLPGSPIYRSPEVRTTVDSGVQRAAENLLALAVRQYAESRISNGAVLAVENRTGAVLAWVGSADFYDDAHDGQVDGVLSAQQPGSSMKPFLYALALESGFSPASVLPDIPMEFGFERLYAPQNFNNRFNGAVRLRVALASSLNIPAVYLLNEIGTERYLSKLAELCFVSLEKSDAGLGLALGNAGVSVFELTQAFSVFARDGVFLPLHGVEDDDARPAAGIRVYDENTARLICDILSDADARALGFGHSKTFITPFPSMFKTGTANQYQTITALGSTADFTVGVWMGNFSGETVIGKTGSSVPAKIARELLEILNESRRTEFKKPSQLRKEKICALSGMRATGLCPHTVYEYADADYARGEGCSWHTGSGVTYPAEYASWFRLKNRAGAVDESGASLRIVSPRNGSVFYYDESVPQDRQRLVVEATGGGGERAEFFVDGKKISESGRPLTARIPLTRGKHSVAVRCGAETEEIVISVR